MFDHMCYSITISYKYLVSKWPETQRSRLVNCPGLEVFVILIVKLLNCNGDTLVNCIIEHNMVLALWFNP